MSSFRGPRKATGALRAVLFDLDDTLFDHARATRSALADLPGLEPCLRIWPVEELCDRHGRVLETLHAGVLAGDMTVGEARVERFRQLLEAAGLPRPLDRARDVARAYRAAYERDWQAVPGAIGLLESVNAKGLRVVIVTNNGVAEQQRKLERCGIGALVHAMVTSEEAGIAKPAPGIFEIALRHAGASAAEAVMVGDAWATDVEGARAAGIRPVWFNRRRQAGPDPTVEQLVSFEPTAPAMAALTRRTAPRAIASETPPLRA
jgi:putative hydrolase of the HAD superfamily